MQTTIIENLEDLDRVARMVVNALGDATVVAFRGEMGAGKTTLINAISKVLGVESDATGSPTFAIINEYRSDTTAELIYHFDCYRLKDYEEALDAGADDYFYSGALCLVEWPERIEEILPDDTVNVKIEVMDDGRRKLTIDTPDAR